MQTPQVHAIIAISHAGTAGIVMSGPIATDVIQADYFHTTPRKESRTSILTMVILSRADVLKHPT